MGDARAEAGRRAVRGRTCSSPRTRPGCSSTASGPGNTSVADRRADRGRQRRRPDQPQNVLDVPEPAVLVKVLDAWEQQRKAAQVLLRDRRLGLHGRLRRQRRPIATKLELARDAAIAALDQFKDADAGRPADLHDGHRRRGRRHASLDLVPVAPMDEGQRTRLRSQIEALFPQNGTPLYQATQDATDDGPRRLRPGADQRRRAADRRRQRRRRSRATTPTSSTSSSALCEAVRASTPRRSGCSRSPTARTPTPPPCAASPRPPTARSTWPPTRPPSTTSSRRSSPTSSRHRRRPGPRANSVHRLMARSFRDRFFTPPVAGP